jgi:AraC-like DNA-binding protein
MTALRFAEPGLAPNQIAKALGVSTRLLQRIFAEHGETLMGRVWEARVSRSGGLLASPEAAHRTITEIALTCGFNDSAHLVSPSRAISGCVAMRTTYRAKAESLTEMKLIPTSLTADSLGLKTNHLKRWLG